MNFEFPECSALDGASILVTGATGSFGKACIRYMLGNYRLRRLVIFSRDEDKQAHMEMEFPVSKYPMIRYFIGDVRDRDRLEMAMYDIDFVIHAAAMKHVETAEYNPFECIRTNIHGTENVVRAALNANVKRVVMLSTDKATSPINLYGASKLAAEKIMIAANSMRGPEGTSFSVVRYGNVLGSRGSVLQIFQRLIAEGRETLPVTDPDMTRFWITLDQGVKFVLFSLGRMRGGEIFVPKIPSMRIGDLAEAVAEGRKLEIVGIRPGEKMHETLVTRDEARNVVDLGNHFIIKPFLPKWPFPTSFESARPVPGDFEYSSDRNDHWLDRESLLDLMAG